MSCIRRQEYEHNRLSLNGFMSNSGRAFMVLFFFGTLIFVETLNAQEHFHKLSYFKMIFMKYSNSLNSFLLSQ